MMSTSRFLVAMATILVLLGAAACKQYDTTDTTPPAPSASVPRDSERAMPDVNRQPQSERPNPSTP